MIDSGNLNTFIKDQINDQMESVSETTCRSLWGSAGLYLVNRTSL